MIIGIDARFAIQNRRGIGNYSLRLIEQLAKIDKHNKYILYIHQPDSEGVLPCQSNFDTKVIPTRNYFLFEQVLLPNQALNDGIDILHCPGNTAPIFLNKRITLITSVLDVMYMKNKATIPQSESLYQRLGRIYRRVIVPRAIKRSKKLISISQFSLNDIMTHFPKLKPTDINITHLAPNENFHKISSENLKDQVRKILGFSDDYVLALGGYDPRKNTELLIKSFLDLRLSSEIEHKLVLVGIPNWRTSTLYDLAKSSRARESIHFTDFISEIDLVKLYNCATVFLYPSLYEGFGLPPLEAMACGVPVITSNTTSIPEVVEDAAIQIDPRNPDRLKQALLAVLGDTQLRATLIERGYAQVSKFSWQRMAEATLDVYQTSYLEREVI